MHNPKRIYLAGPMTGHVEHNFPAFHAAAQRFTEQGWEVVNPADNFGGRVDLPRSSYLRADLMLLTQCDALALLPGWDESNGAKLEYLLALELGMVIFDAETTEPLSKLPDILVTAHTGDVSDETILDEAKRLTGNDRNSDYGHPSDDFQRTARMWTGVLASKLRAGEQITANEVPLCMIAVKLARQAHRHKRDNLVDIAGYARTAAMVAGEK
jgi:hypothetical protein